MGMQCTFKLSELQYADIPYHVEHDMEADVKTLTALRADTVSGEFHQFYVSGDDCWFDVGQATVYQMGAIHWLIVNRVCFQCA